MSGQVTGLGSILILAGRRAGAVDALAEAHGVADKCLVPVAGRPMIAHVLASAAETNATRIFVSSHHDGLADDLGDVVVDSLGDRLVFVPAADNLTDSVLAVADMARSAQRRRGSAPRQVLRWPGAKMCWRRIPRASGASMNFPTSRCRTAIAIGSAIAAR